MKTFFTGLVISSLVLLFFAKADDQKVLSHKKDIVPIVEKRCAMCHDVMPERNWKLYKDAFNKKDAIKLRLSNKTMPVGVPMPDNERALMIEWVNQGAKP